MKKNRIDRDIVVLLVSTLLTVATWVGFEVYRAYKKPNTPAGVEEHLKELTPVLRTDLLDTIEKRSK